MNKKVSTLLTCGLMLGGSLLCSSAFADPGDIVSIQQAETGKTYALISTHYYLNGSWTDRQTNDLFVTYNSATGKYELTNDSSKKTAFSISSTGATAATRNYSFTSAAGAFSVSDVDGKNGSSSFVATQKQGTSSVLEWESEGVKFEVADGATGSDPVLRAVSNSAGVQAFVLEEIAAGDVSDSELNALFNEKGFNLGAKPVLANTTSADVLDNLFEGDTRIWAYEVKEGVDFIAGEKGYKLTNAGENGQDLYIPAGLYFFTERATSDSYDSANGVQSASDIDWLNSTLIAVSPITTVETTDPDREDGEGFELTTVKGEDFIYIDNTSVPEGEDISIYNACFKGYNNHASNANYPYALAIPTFYYQPTTTYEGTTDQESASVYLDVVSYSNTVQHLTTQVYNSQSDIKYVFNLSDSAVLDGIDLLNETKTAAVYTIRFVEGNSEDADLMNKYLTVGFNGTNAFQWEAKGAAIANTTFPAFQYVITSVDKESTSAEKYTLVTFTNRETNKSFQAKLFPEEGTNRYSLAIVKDGTVDATAINVVPFTVNTTTYTVDAQDQDNTQSGVQGVNIDENVIVELTKVTPDEYAGFLNVDNGTIRTLTFARDKHVTSNNLYVAVTGNATSGYKVNADHQFATEILDAAQWQLVKNDKPSTISRVFVYNNTATESVDDVPAGDKVSAYSYKLQYINDGSETGTYLEDNVASADALVDVDNASDFYIKENADGSVSFFINYNNDSFKGMVLAPASKQASFDVKYDNNLNGEWVSARPEIYESESEANNLKVYLGEQPASISWEDAGHITIQSELGNYISMDDSNKGIVVNESNEDVYYLHKTDENAVVPSFYISEGLGSATDERMFMFNPVDSVDYYVAPGTFDKEYQAALNTTRVIFKPATINETCDTLTMNVKGEGDIQVAATADNNNAKIWGGLNRFKFQIVETEEGDGLYYIRQTKADADQSETQYLFNINDELALTADKTAALTFAIKGVAAPTANEGVSATDVKVVAYDGAINIKNAAGKNVVVSTILGQIVANEVLTSDNATISVPAGIAIVSVDGEEAVKVSVR